MNDEGWLGNASTFRCTSTPTVHSRSKHGLMIYRTNTYRYGKKKNLNALHIWGSKTTKFPIRIEQTKTLALQLHVHKFPTTQLKIEVSMSSKQTQSRRL